SSGRWPAPIFRRRSTGCGTGWSTGPSPARSPAEDGGAVHSEARCTHLVGRLLLTLSLDPGGRRAGEPQLGVARTSRQRAQRVEDGRQVHQLLGEGTRDGGNVTEGGDDH